MDNQKWKKSPVLTPRKLITTLLVLSLVSFFLVAPSAEAAKSSPTPIIYVASSAETQEIAEKIFAEPMRSRGFEVFVFLSQDPDLPEMSAFYTIKENSRRLAAFVEDLSLRTGNNVFDVVGISQSGIVTRYWLKEFGGAKFVRRAVLLSSMIKGSPFQAQWVEEGECPPANRRDVLPPSQRHVLITPACREQAQNGPEINALNSPQEAFGDVEYYAITTTLEWEAAPYEINFFSGKGNYKNILVQDLCPNEPIIHLTLSGAPSMQSLMANIFSTGKVAMNCSVPVPSDLPTLKDIAPGLDRPLII